MECLVEKKVKTRKKHQCFGCLGVFPVGTEMLYNVSVDAGEFHKSYLCPKCTEILNKMPAYEREELLPGDIAEHAMEEGYV